MRPLMGVRVLDLSRLLPGPFATLLLADLGATVDKIEDPGPGDYLRYVPPHAAGESVSFHLLNRGKRSAILDLKKPQGREALTRLVGHYDVVLDQFRPRVMDRLGVGHADLRARYPRLIICALTGYGQTGLLADRAGHDLNYLARAGVLGVQGPAGGPPCVPGFQMADISGGMWCTIAILAALQERANTGVGAVLDIAMTDGVFGFSIPAMAAALAGSSVAPGGEAVTGGIAPYNTYIAKDGHPMTLAIVEPKFWATFCAGVGLDVDMSALMPGPHQTDLKARIGEIFRGKTREEWLAFAEKHDCCIEPVLAPQEIRSDPHLASRQLFFEIMSSAGPVPQFRTPITPRDVAFSAAPRAGEHTRTILREANFGDEEIEQLLSQGVVRET